MSKQTYHIAAAIVRQDDRILLVQQQGRDDPTATWALPGGIIEPGELIPEALVREVREETGLTITETGPLAYLTQVAFPQGEQLTLAFVFEVRAWDGTLKPDDPNQANLAAEFVSQNEALARLRGLE